MALTHQTADQWETESRVLNGWQPFKPLLSDFHKPTHKPTGTALTIVEVLGAFQFESIASWTMKQSKFVINFSLWAICVHSYSWLTHTVVWTVENCHRPLHEPRRNGNGGRSLVRTEIKKKELKLIVLSLMPWSRQVSKQSDFRICRVQNLYNDKNADKQGRKVFIHIHTHRQN